MDQFGSSQTDIARAGSLVFIAAQKRSSMFHLPDGDPVAYFAKHPIPFPFLLDQNRAVTHAYGVYQRLSLDAINIARPATFVISPDSQIRYLYVGASQTDRAPLTQVFEIFHSIPKA